MDEKKKTPDSTVSTDAEISKETFAELSDGKGDEDNE